jgi:hypothetical protein
LQTAALPLGYVAIALVELVELVGLAELVVHTG